MVALQLSPGAELLVLATVFFLVVGVPIVILHHLHTRGQRVAAVEAELEDDFEPNDHH